jgi:hypothetical protein
MSPAKKQASASGSGWLGSLFSWLRGSGRPVLIFSLLVGLFVGGVCVVWFKLRQRIQSAPEYRVGPEQVEITPLPPWIHTNIREFRAEVFRHPTLDGPLSIMDDGLAERINKAFSQHAWVAKVERVTAHHPASVQVELVYREPVCMVDVPGGLLPLPVDKDGVLLPDEGFSSVEKARRYPRLVGVERKPFVQPGSRWSDVTVIGGAEIAAALTPVWEKMQLQQIVSQPPTSNARGSAREPSFSLLTARGTKVLWGYAPGANVFGEPSVAEKVTRLQQYWSEYDSLDDPQGKPQQLDIHTMRASPRP